MLPIIKKIWSNDVAELTDRIKRVKSSDLTSTKYLVFKCSQKLLDTIKYDIRARTEIVERTQGKDVYILLFSISLNEHLLHKITIKGIIRCKDLPLIEEIKNFDLIEVIDRTNGDCFLEAPSNMHFITPSGRHAIRFLRLTDALYSYNALDRISFWLQPYIAKSSAVIIDTWSLSSIILRTLQLLELNIPFDCFHEHVKTNDALALETLNKFARRITGDRPILVLVGISSSGDFSNALPHLLERSKIRNKLEILSIYGFKNTPNNIDLLARLNVGVDSYDESDCEYCRSGVRNITYQIDSKYYYPRKYEEKPVRFTKSLLKDSDGHAESSATKFIQKYGGGDGVLVVHRDDPNDGMSPRHHAFYIDVVQLMSVEAFIEDLNTIIANIEDKNGIPDIVISPPHAAAKVITQHLKNRWTKSTFIFCHSLKDLNSEALGQFKTYKHICFVDDVVMSGSRIAGYLRNLREDIGGATLKNLKSVSWFPLILRPASEIDIVRIKDSLSMHESNWKNELFFISKIILPDWSDERECPWCQEKLIFDQHLVSLFDEPEWYMQRRTLLDNIERGIKVTPLFVDPFSQHKTLGAGSILGEEGLGEMQLIFLLANGLQILRKKNESALGRDDLLYRYTLFWEANAQDEKCGTFTRFSEPLVQSCFLRVVKLNEWSRTIWTEGRRFLAQKLESGDSNELIGEALLFHLRRGSDNQMLGATIDKIQSIINDEAIQLLLSKVRK